MTKLFVSATGITDFLSCPYKFKLRQELAVKNPVDNLGLIVHRAMEKDEEPVEKQAKAFYKQLKNMIVVNQIHIKQRELKEKWEILPGIIFTRILDVVGTMRGKSIIADYKTSDWPWRDIDGIIPQAMTIQATAYLHPPPRIRRKDASLVFLVVNKKGMPKTFTYTFDAQDDANLMNTFGLIQYSAARDIWPYNRGKNCYYCDYAAACLKTCGWKELYVNRERKE
jgi:CRISPR/Cas system-associated exonuclease Cas4 (RecB family)